MPSRTKTTKRKPAGKKKVAAPARKRAMKPKPRADYGAPIDGFFAKQPPTLRPILEALRKLVEEVLPQAQSSIKWGMPFFSVEGAMVCALGAHKSHVNLILAGPPDAFDDPKGRLSGEAKMGRHLKLTRLEDLPREDVRRWIATSAALARKKG